ncbi:hypothetical protein DQ353_06850 [Arthrobacter sp. AQ5-05]|uniref:hypothetical protein n=1 Tax=Arthrobacter sp. AQ5-05 TaxID=2184581 RepID=UPI000DCE8A7D|nr:hypothetical protein [Arthrobacter sp. AQ5-05]RAX49877.1 hypothetical protein DQ353_06850 [Arthrobacter sp. AQ5-05]
MAVVVVLLAPAGWMQWTVLAVGGVVGLTGRVDMPVGFILFGWHLVARPTVAGPLDPAPGGPRTA